MSEVTEVRFGLGLIQMNLDEKEKVLETSVWTQMVILGIQAHENATLF